MTTSAFLAAILPREGLRCAVSLGPGGPRQKFFEMNEQAAEWMLAEDARGDRAVYHACATYKDNSSRKAENVHSIKSLWLDIDLPWEIAVRELARFTKTVCLPAPTVVASGRGVHSYWPLAKDASHAEWLPYSVGLKQACGEHGFAADPVRTCDAASILRPVGTHNRKHDNETLVTWTGPEGPYPIEAFRSLARSTTSLLGPRPSYVPEARPGALLGKKMEQMLPAPDPANANAIADRCAQMGAMRETKGKLPEPLWRSCLSVLRYTLGGESIAHEWSVGDPRYDPKETQAKLDGISGPHRCETFRGLNPKGCEGCKFALGVSTPLELGRPPYTVPFTIPSISSPAGHENVDSPPLPNGFQLDETGLWYGSEDNKGVIIKKVVSLTPFFLKRIAQTFNEQEGANYVFEIRTPHEVPKEITAGAAKVTGPNAGAFMASLGVRITEGPHFQAYLNEAVAALQAEGKAAVIFKQFGWKNDDTSFLVGDRMYTSEGVVNCSGVGGTQDRARHFSLRGDLASWTDAADRLCAPGCEAQQFAVLASAAAPLMRFHAQDEGGAIYSESSRLSATGKSTSFDAAQSFWGDRDGLAITNIGTIKSRNAIMAVGCNLPVFFDEASMRDPKLLMEFCQTFTNGRGGDGLLQDGTIRQNPLTWQTVLICGSNVPMLEVLSAAGGSDAMTKRILEVCPSLPAALVGTGEGMRRQMKANSGQAGHRYLRYLTQTHGAISEIKARVEKEFNHYGAGFDREARFLVRLIASASVAGSILKNLDIFHCDPIRMSAWAIGRARQQLDDASSFARTEAITLYLGEHPNDILTTMHEGRKAGPLLHRPARMTRGRYETQTGLLYIAIPPFRKWLSQHDYSYDEVCAEARKSSRLLETKLVTLTAGTGMPGAGQTQCLVLRSDNVGLGFDMITKSNVVEIKR